MMKLPELDTKSYETILAEAIARIPFLTDRWTDFNPQDTGIMLLELMAGLTEMQNFTLDQVGDTFLLPYLRMIYGEEVRQETLAEYRELLARECAEPARAVTPADFETLAFCSPFGINQAHAAWVDGSAVLTIFRTESPLSPREERDLYRYMKSRCLLGTRLVVRQAPRLRTRVVLRVSLNPKAGREETARAALSGILSEAMEDKPLNSPLDTGQLLADLLALPEIACIKELRILCDSGGGWREIFSYGHMLMDAAADNASFPQETAAEGAGLSPETAGEDAVMLPETPEIIFED